MGSIVEIKRLNPNFLNSKPFNQKGKVLEVDY